MIGDADPMWRGAAGEQDAEGTRGYLGGVFLAVIDPASFGEAEEYATLVGENLAAAKRVPPAAGTTEVLVPGEPEVRTREQRGREGIPLPEATWRDLAAVSARFGVALPEDGAR
jgi:uncharacterized oxidoreductase